MITNKRILVVNSHSIYDENSTGITVRSILSSFSDESLLEVHYYPTKESEENRKIESIKLDEKTKMLDSILRKVIKTDTKQKINNSIVNKDKKEKKSFIKSIKTLVLALNDYLPIKMKCNRKQLSRIDEFEPEIIYTLGSAILPLELSLFFSNRYNIPIVLHHMDNWRETKYTENLLMKPVKKRLIRKLENIEKNMEYGMTISDSMANYYDSITETKYLSLMHVVPEKTVVEKHDDNAINIVYAGGLHLSRWKVLSKLEKVLKRLVKEGNEVRLSIYTKDTDRESYEELFDRSITTFFQFLPYDEVHQIYEVADVLVHVESFDEDIVKFTKYSLSTKIPEYMSVGKPILCYAPNGIAVSQYIKENNCGFAVSSSNELYNSLTGLIKDKSLRKRLGNNGRYVVKTKHSEEYKNVILKKVFKISN